EHPLSSVEGRNSLTNRTVEIAKVLLNLPEIRQQSAGRRGDVRKSLLDPGRIEYIKRAVADLRNLLVDFLPASLKLADSRPGVHLGPLDKLMQQVEDRHQPRFGADEASLPEIDNPVYGPLSCGRDVEMDFIVIGRIVFAQPGMFVGGPAVE